MTAARALLLSLVVALVASGCAASDEGSESQESDTRVAATTERERALKAPPQARLRPFARVPGITTVSAYDAPDEGIELWRDRVPQVQDIRFRSTADASRQPALWLPPHGGGPAPLLVVVHSWSYGYRAHSSIPFGLWAQRNGWAMIAPDFRGVNERPEATGSDVAVQDVVDAVDFALEQGGVDARRVFVIGYSGGGMMSLLAAARHPDRFAGVISFVPVYDVVDWYGHVRANLPDRAYADQIVASCGGDPSVPGAAQRSCRERSPSAYVDRLREAGVPVYIAHGLEDPIVPPSYAALAFDRLAQPGDRLGRRFASALRQNRLPADVAGSADAETYFRSEDPEVLFARSSRAATLVVFDGEHDMAYHPGLEWAYRLASRR